MNHYRLTYAPRVWKPLLHPRMVGWLRGLRLRHQRRHQQLVAWQVVGSEQLRAVLADDCGVLVMPNHPSHADPFTMYLAADQLKTACYIMATWHVFHGKPFWTQRILQWHGCFSVDREANDIGAFRQAVGLLENRPHPLVIFPEGEIYHCNDRMSKRCSTEAGPLPRAESCRGVACGPVRCSHLPGAPDGRQRT